LTRPYPYGVNRRTLGISGPFETFRDVLSMPLFIHEEEVLRLLPMADALTCVEMAL